MKITYSKKGGANKIIESCPPPRQGPIPEGRVNRSIENLEIKKYQSSKVSKKEESRRSVEQCLWWALTVQAALPEGGQRVGGEGGVQKLAFQSVIKVQNM